MNTTPNTIGRLPGRLPPRALGSSLAAAILPGIAGAAPPPVKVSILAGQSNMVNFVNDVRKDLGVKDLPFAVANTGVAPESKLCGIQLALGDAKKHPEFAETVASVDTRGFKRTTGESPSHFGYHWNPSGESHFLVGDAMGQATVKLLEKQAGVK